MTTITDEIVNTHDRHTLTVERPIYLVYQRARPHRRPDVWRPIAAFYTEEEAQAYAAGTAVPEWHAVVRGFTRKLIEVWVDRSGVPA